MTYDNVLVDAKHIPQDPGIKALDEEISLLMGLAVSHPTV
jgi:hypothetical protein